MIKYPAISVNFHVDEGMKVGANLNTLKSVVSLSIKPAAPAYPNVTFIVDDQNLQWIHDLADQLGQISQDLRRAEEERQAQAQAMANSGVFEIIIPETGALAPR